MNHLPLIIQREYLTKVRNKSFIIMTFLSPLIFIGLISLVVYLTQLNKNQERTISILDETGKISEVFLTENAQKDEMTTYKLLTGITLEEAKKQVQETEEYGLLHIRQMASTEEIARQIKFYSEDSPSQKIISKLEAILSRKLTQETLLQNNVDIDVVKNSKMNVSIGQETFTGERTSKFINYSKLGFGFAAGYLLFMFIIIYGNMIMRSVIEEKTNRIIEIIISSVKPIQLLMGKIIGTSLAGITQFLMWIVFGGILLVIISFVFGIDLIGSQAAEQQALLAQQGADVNFQVQITELINSLPIVNLLAAFFIFFIGGYLLYSSLYAAIGAAVDNETDTQQFMMPILMPLILAVYVGGFTVLDDPHGTVATVFSYIPFTSPVVMLMRIPFGVPIWEQLISILLLYVTFVGTVWFASKIYRVGILMYGKKPSYKEIFKWLKY
ncbi:ABC-2 type transport system permease protein [Kordia periserrulae]|uniref:ABC-2 type transport system permease protein n=1 Tax=Kordia periserrulae TaxID=701523 RepID=A0A2T6BTZ0_9FLAO|nr:ABC transporter permease [Kordia periserrulae]PTX59529.1 ABC-2 type transport system permease protein [Kordia periserrulae]